MPLNARDLCWDVAVLQIGDRDRDRPYQHTHIHTNIHMYIPTEAGRETDRQIAICTYLYTKVENCITDIMMADYHGGEPFPVP